MADLPHHSKAIAAFHAVISAYEQPKEPRLQELAGDAHGRLGLIHRLMGQSGWIAEVFEGDYLLEPAQ